MSLHEQKYMSQKNNFEVSHVDLAIAEEVSTDLGTLIRFIKKGPIEVIKQSDDEPNGLWIYQDDLSKEPPTVLRKKMKEQAIKKTPLLFDLEKTIKIVDLLYSLHPKKKCHI